MAAVILFSSARRIKEFSWRPPLILPEPIRHRSSFSRLSAGKILPAWDEAGKTYLIAWHFAIEPENGKTYNIYLFGMDPQGDALIAGADRILHQSRGSEANKLYKYAASIFTSLARREWRVAW